MEYETRGTGADTYAERRGRGLKLLSVSVAVNLMVMPRSRSLSVSMLSPVLTVYCRLRSSHVELGTSLINRR